MGRITDALAGALSSRSTGLPPSSPWATRDLSEILWPEIGFVGITRAAAMTVPAAAQCRNLIAGTLAGAPISEWSTAGRLDTRPFLVQPDPDLPRAVTMAWTYDDLIFHGISYWRVLSRDAATNGGRPRHARRIDPAVITFADDGVTPLADDGEPVAPADWLVIPGPHEGVLRFGARELATAYALTGAARRFADVPMAALELHDVSEDGLDDDARRKLVEDWTRARQSTGVAYTNRSLEIKAHGWTAADLQMVEARAHQAVEIARVFGVRAALLDAGSPSGSMTYASLTDARRDFVDFTLAPYADAFAGRMSMDDVTEAGRTVAVRLDATVLRASFRQRMDAYAAAQAAGIYTAEELRKAEEGRPGELS